MVVQFQPNRQIPIPSVAPEARILSVRTRPEMPVRFFRDGAGNYSVMSPEAGQCRIVFVTDAPSAYFGAVVPPSVTAADVPQNLRPQLPANVAQATTLVIDRLGLDSFDPSVSPRLTPRDLRDGCSVPFLWRPNSMQVRDLSQAQIRRFVFDAVIDGASGVFCAVARTMTDSGAVQKVHTFVDALSCRTHFWCNHASNYLSLQGRIPNAKTELLAQLDAALKRSIPLRPEWLRGL